LTPAARVIARSDVASSPPSVNSFSAVAMIRARVSSVWSYGAMPNSVSNVV
jgi:hypothetical protein